jgi:hypothetical protein
MQSLLRVRTMVCRMITEHNISNTPDARLIAPLEPKFALILDRLPIKGLASTSLCGRRGIDADLDALRLTDAAQPHFRHLEARAVVRDLNANRDDNLFIEHD